MGDDSLGRVRVEVSRIRLIVFTRLPVAGENKTRLMPELGAEAASRLHERLARHAIGRASAFCLARNDADLEIRVTGGTTAACRDWLGGGDCRAQGQGNLGDRLGRAVEDALGRGVGKVLVIGTDCPRLDEAVLRRASDELDGHDVVLGPAEDGGYYLIGLKVSNRSLFDGISWGGSEVFAQTMERIERLGLSAGVLDRLSDVDRPQDLPDGEKALAEGARVSVVIPGFDGVESLEECLQATFRGGPWEVMVIGPEGGEDARGVAERLGAHYLGVASCRDEWMVHAAARISGEFLLFCHGGSRPPADYCRLVFDTLSRPGVAAGRFEFGQETAVGPADLNEHLSSCLSTGSQGRDKGLFLRRSLFRHLVGL